MMFLGKQSKELPFFVAEIGSGFDNYDHLCETVILAKSSGADFAKIQYYKAEDLVQDNGFEWEGRNLFQLYKNSEFNQEWLAPIFEFGTKNHIPVFSSVYSIRGLQKLEAALCPAYKISSFENQHLKLLQAVSDTNKPWIMSTGMLNNEQLDKVLEEVYPHILLHCVSKYPCAFEEADLSRMKYLDDYVHASVGYSDHVEGGLAVLLAASMGAKMIEMHFATEPNENWICDANDFRHIVKMARNVNKAIISDEVKELTEIKEQRMLGKERI